MQSQPRSNPLKGIIPWSYSSLTAYETCPYRRYVTSITKQVREEQNASNVWGNAVHKALENAVRGTEGLPHRFAAYQPLVSKVMASPGVKEAERNFALTESFRPTGYWDSDAWVRGKADVTITYQHGMFGTLLDWKTGKPKADVDQLRLFAAVLLAEKPEVPRVKVGYIWLANDKVDAEVVERAEAPEIWKGFVHRVARMKRSAENNDFPKTPSGLCREYCPVGRKLCEHCGRP